MAKFITKWQAEDGTLHDTEQQADDHELVSSVATILQDAALTHQSTTFHISDWYREVADLLVMTDAFARLNGFLSDKGL
jgi:hypothetical protein